jgi:hypothetical protein
VAVTTHDPPLPTRQGGGYLHEGEGLHTPDYGCTCLPSTYCGGSRWHRRYQSPDDAALFAYVPPLATKRFGNRHARSPRVTTPSVTADAALFRYRGAIGNQICLTL